MKPKIIKDFDQIWYNHQVINNRNLLKNNIFPGLPQVIDVIYDIISDKLKSDAITKSFDDIFISEEIQKINLHKGDIYYVELIENSNIINENNEDLLSSEPLTKVVKQVISLIKGERIMHEETLSIYSEMKDFLMHQLGKTTALDQSFKTYQSWLMIHYNHEFGHHFSQEWLAYLPMDKILDAQHSIIDSTADHELADLAIIIRPSDQNPEACRNYLQMLTQYESKGPYQYIKKATDGMDLIDLRKPIDLNQQLSFKAGLNHWLTYLDSLKYPLVQSYLLLNIEEPEDFLYLIELIMSSETLNSPKVKLILLVLDRYFEYLDHNLFELKRYNADNILYERELMETVIKEATTVHDDWLQRLIPTSFQQIFNTIFNVENKDHVLTKALFLWVSSHSKVYVYPDLKSRLKLIDILNDQFLQSLTNANIELQFFIKDDFSLELNWQSLNLLVDLLPVDCDIKLKDTILELYMTFIENANFSYSAGGNANMLVLINNAYKLSTMLERYVNSYGKWKALYFKYKIHYNGWLMNRDNYHATSRDSFLLTVGIGLSHFLFSSDKLESATQNLLDLSTIFIRQIRQQCTKHNLDYEIPLRLMGITIGKFYNEEIITIVNDFTDYLDDLEYILILWQELISNVEDKSISPKIVSKITLRIENEFWMVESRYKQISQQNTLNYFRGLKEKVTQFSENHSNT